MPLEHAWREWKSFLLAAGAGLEPQPPSDTTIRAALAALSPEELGAFLDDAWWRRDRESTQPRGALELILLCALLPPTASTAYILAERYDDPVGLKSSLPPPSRLGLFFTFRWRVFLQCWFARKAAVLDLLACRAHLQGFVEHWGDAQAQTLLKTHDPPALIRELTQAEREHTRRRPVS